LKEKSKKGKLGHKQLFLFDFQPSLRPNKAAYKNVKKIVKKIFSD
jgi:hypothetical protein